MMKNREKIFLIFVVIISLNLIYCGKKQSENTADLNNVQKVENKEQNKNNDTTNETKKSSEKEDEMNYGEGINEEFTTDGKLHEEKFLNKTFGYPDTADNFKIEKDSEGYFITDYIDESPILEKDVSIKEEKSRLKLENGVYLVHNDGMAYAYDTKLKKVVLLNKENNFRIKFIAEE